VHSSFIIFLLICSLVNQRSVATSQPASKSDKGQAIFEPHSHPRSEPYGHQELDL
jgi:hypothetical protein